MTLGLQKTFGSARVFDTPLDEQTILGLALGASLAGLLPIAEIQYLAYLHNAEDQLRGEAATLGFFSDGQYANGLVVRIAALASLKGFGGHFHNDNAIGVLRDIPGIVVACPSSAAEAPELLRTLAGLAVGEGRVGVLLEPTALYHDKGEAAPYAAPERLAPPGTTSRDMGRLHWGGSRRAGRDVRQRRGDGAASRRARRASTAVDLRPALAGAAAGPAPAGGGRRRSRGCWSSTRPGAPGASPKESSRRSSRAATPVRSSG